MHGFSFLPTYIFRTVASTNMNDVSSRSHAIFTILFTQVRTQHWYYLLCSVLVWVWEKQKGKNHVTFLTSLRCGSFILSCFFLSFFRRSSTLTCRVKLSARFILLTWQEGKLYYLTCFERRMLFFFINHSQSRFFKGSSPWHLCSCFILLLMHCFFNWKISPCLEL